MRSNEILEAIDRQYMAEHWLEEPDGRWPLRPSAGDQCMRATSIALLNPELERHRTPELLRQFARGHQRGWQLAKKLQKALKSDDRVLSVEMEIPTVTEIPISFRPNDPLDRHLDRWGEVVAGCRFRRIADDSIPTGYRGVAVDGEADIVVTLNNQERWLIDCKAEGAYSFSKDEPGYLAQQGLYAKAVSADRCFLLRECQEQDYRKGSIVGEHKLTELPHGSCLEAADRVLEAWTDMLRDVRDGRSPLWGDPNTIHGDMEWKGKALPWRCNYCPLGKDAPVTHRCWPDHTLNNEGTEDRPKWKSV